MAFYFIWLLINIILLMINKKNNLSIIIIFIIFTLVYGCRNYGGIDDSIYISSFYNSINDAPVYGLEDSYIILSKILGSLGFNYKSIFLVYAIISFSFIYLAYREICKERYDWAIAILGFLTFLFIPTITIMRQFAATSIIMYALICFNKKCYRWSICLIILATTIHVSAVLVFIILPVFMIKIKRRIKLFLPLLCMFIGYVGILPLLCNIFSLIIPSKYIDYLNASTQYRIGFLHAIMLTLYLGQFILDIINRNNKVMEKQIDFIEKGEMIYFSIYFISLSVGWVNRLSIYFMLFLPLVFKTFIYRFTLRKDRQILYVICYGAYIALFIYQILGLVNSTTMDLIPYNGSLDFFG